MTDHACHKQEADIAAQKRLGLQVWAEQKNREALKREAWYRHLKRIRPDLAR